MATDIARLSFDPARRYTGLVTQQGRVTLEAEHNEQRRIDAEERRLELLDVVGPAGTPDDGYAISDAGPGTLIVGAGTMYVGGLRVALPEAIDAVQTQTDWLDRPDDAVQPDTRAHVVLTLTETEVTAVEDPALAEVALGGPDGAARTRLLQHIEARATDATDCATALAEDVQRWAGEGLDFDPATMQLLSRSRLEVTFQVPAGADDPCAPAASGGYLGAENQLIRVQVVATDPDLKTFTIAWGYDDASMLYRVTPSATGLVLQRSPVDDFHRPRTGQAMQLLPSTAQLGGPNEDAFVAALDGPVQVLSGPYDPDTRTIPWPLPLPADYATGTGLPPLFVRAWEQPVTAVTLGQTVDLTGTGLQVTLTTDGGGLPHVGDFWCIGVRPGAPTSVYPERLLHSPQPPDGPRLWACPLAVVDYVGDKRTLEVLADCRHRFVPLVDIETGAGCCTLEVTPADAGTLQQKIDSVALGRNIHNRAARITVCFKPGLYELSAPLQLGEQHSRLILAGCSGATIVSALPEAVDRFDQGLIQLAEADDVTITGMEFRLPLVKQNLTFSRPLRTALGAEARPVLNALAGVTYYSVGIRPVDCAVLTVSECLFRYALPPADNPDELPNVFGTGIFASGNVWGARITRNEFLHDPMVALVQGAPYKLLAGYLASPLSLADIVSGTSAGAQPGFVTDLDLLDNRMSGLALAAYVLDAQGRIRIAGNVVRDGYIGFGLVPSFAVRVRNEADDEMRAFLDLPAVVGIHAIASVFSPQARSGAAANARGEGVVDIDDAVTIVDNDVQCMAPDQSVTGPALFVGGTFGDMWNKPSVTVSGNRLIGPASDTVAQIGQFGFGAITGNVCVGDRDGESLALAVFRINNVTITGNVASPRADLPTGRPFPAPFDTWLPFNTVG